MAKISSGTVTRISRLYLFRFTGRLSTRPRLGHCALLSQVLLKSSRNDTSTRSGTRVKRGPGLRNRQSQGTGSQEDAKTPKDGDKPERKVGVGIAPVSPKSTESLRLSTVHVYSKFSQPVPIDGELGKEDAFMFDLTDIGPPARQMFLDVKAKAGRRFRLFHELL